MKHSIIIEGMSCGHCSARVEQALNSLPGVTATVDLATKTATVTGDVLPDVLRAAVTEVGYQVISIS